jgi:hypothetical protein
VTIAVGLEKMFSPAVRGIGRELAEAIMCVSRMATCTGRLAGLARVVAAAMLASGLLAAGVPSRAQASPDASSPNIGIPLSAALLARGVAVDIDVQVKCTTGQEERELHVQVRQAHMPVEHSVNGSVFGLQCDGTATPHRLRIWGSEVGRRGQNCAQARLMYAQLSSRGAPMVSWNVVPSG